MNRILALTLALLMLTVLLSGCVVQKVDVPSAPQIIAQTEPSVITVISDEEEEELDAQIPEEYELLGDEDDDSLDDFEFDLPRTIEAAPEGTLVDGIKVDYIVSDTKFASQIDEFAYFYDEYIGKTFSLIGYVMLGEDENSSFAIVRDFEELHSDDEEGFDDEEGDEHIHPIYQVGIDCYFEGTMPKEDAWVRVVGALAEYDYIDTETQEAFPALRLAVESVKEIPETEGGSRMVSE